MQLEGCTYKVDPEDPWKNRSPGNLSHDERLMY